MGTDISTTTIFEEALEQFIKRFATLKPFLLRSSIPSRNIIVNVHFLPIFYYLAYFYAIPPNTLLIAKTTLRKVIIAFSGGYFGYAHLVAPKLVGGFSTPLPLRDLWSTNYSSLTHFDFSSSQGSLTICDITLHNYLKVITQNNSLLIEDHRSYAAFVYLRDVSPAFSMASPYSAGYWPDRESPIKKTSTWYKIN